MVGKEYGYLALYATVSHDRAVEVSGPCQLVD